MKKLHINIKTGGKRGTILFIHGSSSSSRVFDPIMQSQTIPYKLISFDLPGHGLSWRGGENEYGLETYKKAISQVLREVGDPKDILLAGNSFGGHLAIETAPYIAGLKGLIIFGTPPVKKPLNLTDIFLPNPVVQDYFSEEVGDEALDAALDNVVYNKSAIPVIREDFRLADPKIRTANTKDMANDAFSNEYKIFTELNVPRFILHGGQETMVNPDYLKQLCKANNEGIKFSLIENCGHYPSIERPDIFTEKVKEFAAQAFN